MSGAPPRAAHRLSCRRGLRGSLVVAAGNARPRLSHAGLGRSRRQTTKTHSHAHLTGTRGRTRFASLAAQRDAARKRGAGAPQFFRGASWARTTSCQTTPTRVDLGRRRGERSRAHLPDQQEGVRSQNGQSPAPRPRRDEDGTSTASSHVLDPNGLANRTIEGL